MKKPKPIEIALYATIYGGLMIWLGTAFVAEKDNAIKGSQLARFHCYGDHVGVLGQFKDNWYSTENKTRTVNGERIKLKENEPVKLDYTQCTFNYNIDAKYHAPVGLTRKTERGTEATIVSYRAVGRGYTLTVDVNSGHVDMAQSSFLKQYPIFVSW